MGLIDHPCLINLHKSFVWFEMCYVVQDSIQTQMKRLFQPLNHSNLRSSMQTQRWAPSPTPVQVITAPPAPLPVPHRDEVGKRPSQQFVCHIYFSASAASGLGVRKIGKKKKKLEVVALMLPCGM